MSEIILEIDQLTKSYGDKVILDNISLSVVEGEVLVVLGPSGCGKSTLLRSINGLETIQSGQVKLRGESVLTNKKSLPLLRQRVGMVFQSYDLFPHLNVLDNLMLGPTKAQKRSKEEVKAEALHLLKRVGLEEKAHSYASELSGGQKQRVAIIRALLLRPEVLLLDEITASLDPEMVREVLDLVGELAKEGRTMLIVTHELQFARAIADQVIFIDKGKIIEKSDAETFFTNPKTQRAHDFLTVFDYSNVTGAV
ncbi:amino acid ABC transporter ATP-binding protein [Streptococcus dentiloxodontae]